MKIVIAGILTPFTLGIWKCFNSQKPLGTN